MSVAGQRTPNALAAGHSSRLNVAVGGSVQVDWSFQGSSAYRLTTLITCTLGGSAVPIAGFVDGPIIQVRP